MTPTFAWNVEMSLPEDTSPTKKRHWNQKHPDKLLKDCEKLIVLNNHVRARDMLQKKQSKETVPFSSSNTVITSSFESMHDDTLAQNAFENVSGADIVLTEQSKNS